MLPSAQGDMATGKRIPLTEVNTGELLASWTMLLGYEEYPPLTPHGGEI